MFTPRRCGTVKKLPCAEMKQLEDGERSAVQQLRESILELGFTLEEAASFVQESKVTIWRWSNGLTRINAAKLAVLTRAAFGTDSIRVCRRVG